MRIVTMTPAHAGEVLAVYQEGIDSGDSTFETLAPDWHAFDRSRLPSHRFVATDEGTGQVRGWTAVSAISPRQAYAGVVEHAIYVAGAARRQGIGAALLAELISSTEAAGIWTIQSGIFPENAASLALHRRAGFREVGVRQRIGTRCGVWRDVVLVERRSRRAGC
jgi:L-amino acid N-acyltransferase YncA